MTSASTMSVVLNAEVQGRLQRLAETRQRSSESIMQVAIEEYVSREEREEQLRQDTLDSWEHSQQTHLHVTHDEFKEWVAKLEAGDDQAKLRCHR